MFRNVHLWLPYYIQRRFARRRNGNFPITDLFFCICDHFEPYWNNADSTTARRRIRRWVDEYPKYAEKHRDSEGRALKYAFFYPEEEYCKYDIEVLSELCRAGYAEVEIHLHHDNDTPDNLRHKLVEYKKRLHGEHGLLSTSRETGEIVYGFIHGNWALDNSRPDGKWCGVNNEIDILLETGCYADFTMPSAPSDTQTKKVNSIYYALDDPSHPKSHNDGIDACRDYKGEGLLMVQGPLALNWKCRKFGMFPGIENGGILGNLRPSKDRIAIWADERIHISGNPSWVFVKVHTHGAQEGVMKMLFDEGGFEELFAGIEAVTAERNIRLHYVCPREMANAILAVEQGIVSYDPAIRRLMYVN